jgi:two-component system sensor histidine kinase BaeS
VRRRFFWSLMAVAVATLAVGGLTAALLINRSVERSAREEFNRQAEATARLIENELQAPAAPGRRTIDLARLLQTVAIIGGHDYVEAALVGPVGARTELGTGFVLLDQIPGGVEQVRGRVQFEADVDGRQVTAFALPVPAAERGTVVVVIGTDLELVPWREVLVRFLWAIGLAALLAALLAGSLSRFLGRRLDGLRSASARLAGGDLTARAPVSGEPEEIAEVAAAFNDMGVQLEAARRREREFLASVGHDLRTPLTTIGGYAEALSEGKVDAEALPRVAGVIDREAERLSRLVEDLMLLTRLEAREFSLRPEEVDVTGHLGGIVESFRRKAEDAGVALESDLDRLPPMMIDPDRLVQIVGNLIENALRYTPEGGRVHVGLHQEEGAGVVVVSDNGPGMEPEDLPYIFERLYVTQRYRPVRPEGSGLGLSIVRELVDAMGGTVSVDTMPGRGTSFEVRLPLR